MCISKYQIELMMANDSTQLAELQVWEEDENDEIRMDCVSSDLTVSVKVAEKEFNVFCLVRRKLEVKGILPICFGACENVYPSPMSLQMGGGTTAYMLKMGQQARMANLVFIYDCDESVKPVTVDQQEQFYQSWLSSLKQ